PAPRRSAALGAIYVVWNALNTHAGNKDPAPRSPATGRRPHGGGVISSLGRMRPAPPGLFRRASVVPALRSDRTPARARPRLRESGRGRGGRTARDRSRQRETAVPQLRFGSRVQGRRTRQDAPRAGRP